MRRRALAVVALATMLFALPFAARAAMMPWAQADPALWRWLPHGEDMFQPERRGLSSNASLGFTEMFALPPGKTIVYDAKRHIVLYYEGCCTYQMTVLAVVPDRPPKTLPFASLGALHTARGIALGASAAAVRRAYGPARLHRSTVAPGLRVLSYYRAQAVPGASCGWYENFVFRGNRLTEIQAGHSC